MMRPSTRWSRRPVNGNVDLIDSVKLLGEISRQEA